MSYSNLVLHRSIVVKHFWEIAAEGSCGLSLVTVYSRSKRHDSASNSWRMSVALFMFLLSTSSSNQNDLGGKLLPIDLNAIFGLVLHRDEIEFHENLILQEKKSFELFLFSESTVHKWILSSRWIHLVNGSAKLSLKYEWKAKVLFFSKWKDFHLIRWIRRIGQNNPCMHGIQLPISIYFINTYLNFKLS